MNNSVYYIGFNANNAICNQLFFKGSITLYPNGEKGNIYYSKKLVEDKNSDEFLNKYKQYIHTEASKIQNKNPKAEFMCFNEKIYKLCEDLKDINIMQNNNENIISFLNNKFKTREMLNEIVPILDYSYYDNKDIKYKEITEKIGTSKFVIQGATGAGGDSTYLITSPEDLDALDLKNEKYCISKYIKNTPLNITTIITDEDILFFPISAQLILLSNRKFKYVGGDFNYIKDIDCEIKKKINNYSKEISENIKKMGYRGIIGIDFILTEEGKIYFMEINPRFQASSFLISIELEDKYKTNLAELHYLAMKGNKIKNTYDLNIEKSFVNCNSNNLFDTLENYKIVTNGYFKENTSSVYRKVFNRKIIFEENFEKCNIKNK